MKMTSHRNGYGLKLRSRTALSGGVIPGLLGAVGLLALPGGAQAIDAGTLPSLDSVVGGDVTINVNGQAMTIQQALSRGVIDWHDFSIGSDAAVIFDQLSGSDAITVNRVTGNDPSAILGQLQANGNIWLLNPNGVLFGESAEIDVGGLVASTGSIDAAAFLGGASEIEIFGATEGSVVNDGQITVAEGGIAAFVAPHVRNNGTITARMGVITLAGAEQATIDLYGDGLLEFAVAENDVSATNTGTLSADGGIVQMSAAAASSMVDSTINMGGVVQASSVQEADGRIILGGGDHGVVTMSGDVVADGGSIDVAARDLVVSSEIGSPKGQPAADIRVNLVLGNDLEAGRLEVTESGFLRVADLSVDSPYRSGGQAAAVHIDIARADGLHGQDLSLGARFSLSQHGFNPSDVVNVTSEFASVQGGIDAVADGGTVNVTAGTFAETLSIRKSLSISGAGEGATTVDARGTSGYGIEVRADDVSLSGFTLLGRPEGSSGTNFGIKVQPATGDAADRTRNFSLRDVTITGFDRAPVDLNGVVGATIDNVTIDGRNTGGAGIQLTDSADVTITNTSTTGNDWGSVAIYQTNRFYDQQTGNITIDDTNTFSELLGVFTQRYATTGQELPLQEFGALNLTFASHTVRNDDHRAGGDQYTFYRSGLSDAISTAVNLNADEIGSSIVQGWNGSASTDQYFVGTSALLAGGTGTMSINAATAAAQSGSTINVGAGHYTENVAINRNLTLLSTEGRDQTTIEGISGAGAIGAIQVSGGTTDVRIGAEDQGFTVIGFSGTPGLETASIYFTGGHSGARIEGNTIDANGDGGLITESNATISDFEITGNKFTGQTFLGDNPAGSGFNEQFTLANVPRQLVTMGGGAGGGNTSNIVFTNNTITGIAGGVNSGGQEQGNTLVTIDAANATISGNTFAGTTTRFGSSLRARGPDTTISNNTFSSDGLGAEASHVFIDVSQAGASIEDVFRNNTFDRSAVALNSSNIDHSIGYAVGRADPGGEVLVGAGEYNETVTIDRALTLSGVNAGTAAFTGEGADAAARTGAASTVNGGFVLASDGITIDGFDFVGGATAVSGQGSDARSNIAVSNNRFDGQSGWPIRFGLGGGGGVGSQNWSVTGNHIANLVGADKTAMVLLNIDGLDVSNNVIEHSNAAVSGRRGINIDGVSNATITDNHIVMGRTPSTDADGDFSAARYAIQVASSDRAADGIVISGNTFNDAYDGIVTLGTANSVRNLTISGNEFGSGLRWGVRTNAGSSPNQDHETIVISGNVFDGQVQGGVRLQPGVGSYTDIAIAENTFRNSAGTAVTVMQDGDGIEIDGNTFANNARHILSSQAIDRDGFAEFLADNTVDRAAYVADGDSIYGTAGAAYTAAVDGDDILLSAGTFAETLSIRKSLSISGAGEGATTVDARGTSGYGIEVRADDVSLSGFTLLGRPEGSSGTNFGIKVQPATGDAADRTRNFSLSDVTINGFSRAPVDLNGVVGATIDNVTIDGLNTGGAGIQLTDSADVTITNTSTTGNNWGSVAIYQTNRFYDQQTGNITIDDTNTFGDLLGVFTQRYETAGQVLPLQDFGALNLTFASHTVRNDDHRAGGDQYTFYRSGLSDAISAAVNLNPAEIGSSIVQGWNGSASTDQYFVGTSELLAGGTGTMSINTAIGAGQNGSTVTVGAGTYNETVALDQSRSMIFNDAVVNGLSSSVATGIQGAVTAATGGINLAGPTELTGATTLRTNGGNIALNGVTGAGQNLTLQGSPATTAVSLNSNIGSPASRIGAFTISDVQSITQAPGASAYVTTSSLAAAGDISLSFNTVDALGGITANSGGNLSGGLATSGGSLVAGSGGTTNLTVATNGGNATITGQNVTGSYTTGGGALNLTGVQTVNATGNAGGGSFSATGGQSVGGSFTGGSGSISAPQITSAVNVANSLAISGSNVTLTGSVGNLVSAFGISGSLNGVPFNPAAITAPASQLLPVLGASELQPAGIGTIVVVVSDGTAANQLLTLPEDQLFGLIATAAGPEASAGATRIIVARTSDNIGSLIQSGNVVLIDLTGDGVDRILAGSDEEEEDSNLVI